MKSSKKKKKKKKGSNTGLFIGLGCGAVALLVCCLGAGGGGVGYQQGWFKGGETNAIAKDGPKTDAKAKESKSPEKPKTVVPEKPPEAEATGVVAFIPNNFANGLKAKFGDEKPTTLAEVEKKLGGRGKALSDDQIDPQMKKFMQLAAAPPSTVCYRWTTAKGGKLYIAFNNDLYAGAALYNSK